MWIECNGNSMKTQAMKAMKAQGMTAWPNTEVNLSIANGGNIKQ